MNIKLSKNKIRIIAIVIAILVVMGCVMFYTKNTASKNQEASKTLISYSTAKDGSTVFDALLDYKTTNNIDVEYENNSKYGVFVKSIGGIANGHDGKYWQYYVNGELGDVAADRKNISKSDVVEWRFEKDPYSK